MHLKQRWVTTSNETLEHATPHMLQRGNIPCLYKFYGRYYTQKNKTTRATCKASL